MLNRFLSGFFKRSLALSSPMIFLFLAACGSSGGGGAPSGGGTTPVGITLELPASHAKNQAVGTTLASPLPSQKAFAPSPNAVAKVEIQVTDSGGRELARGSADIQPGQEAILTLDVPVGQARIFTARLLDAGGALLFKGEATTDVSADATASVTIKVVPFIPPSIRISPTDTSVIAGREQIFTATVTGLSDTRLTWSVNDVVGGNETLGTITPNNPTDPAQPPTGTYKAPATSPDPNSVTIKAASVAEPTILSNTAKVKISPGLFVDPTGNDSDDCGNETSPCKTITKGLSRAQTGDTLIINPGIYRFTGPSGAGEPVPLQMKGGIAIQGKNPAIQGENQTKTFLDFTDLGDAAEMTGADNARLSSIVLQGNGPIRLAQGTPTLSDNLFTTSLRIVGGNPTIKGNTFSKIGGTALIIEGTANPDLGGGVTGSTGGNTFSCNRDADLFNRTTNNILAKKNLWDNNPPTRFSEPKGGVDIAGGPVDSEENSLAPSPCSDTPPTAPTNLQATAAGETQINLTWNASTDNVGISEYRVERCQGSNCTNFTALPTAAPITATTYSDTGLSVNIGYRYRVRAVDLAGNFGPYSNDAGVTTPDRTPPSVPGNLRTTAVRETEIVLAWDPSNDNIGVARYEIQRCQGNNNCTNFEQIATTTTPGYTNTGLTPDTPYRYRVRAADAAGNLSNYSNTLDGRTSADRTPPSVPTGLSASNRTETSITLTWNASTDNIGVARYEIERCLGSECARRVRPTPPTAISYTDSGLSPGTTYTYRVRAIDAAGNSSGDSDGFSVATLADTTPPPPPAGLTSPAQTETTISLSWTAPSDPSGIREYVIERCITDGCEFVEIRRTTETRYTDTGLPPGTRYSYQIKAIDGANNHGGYARIDTATRNIPTYPLTVTKSGNGAGGVTSSPGGINCGETCSAPFASGTRVTLTAAANDGSAVVGFGNGCASETATCSFTITADVPVTVTFNDIQAPTPPADLRADPGSNGVFLIWSPSTDNIGVVRYEIERCFVNPFNGACSPFSGLSSTDGATTQYSDGSVEQGGIYRYHVQAVDAARNPSAYSNEVEATIPRPIP